uniref:F-box domain-containing protein n=1 Tax=Glossina palpalis gambiensis TaxID=67801 RepID=A0A1B0BGM7_9MUSC
MHARCNFYAGAILIKRRNIHSIIFHWFYQQHLFIPVCHIVSLISFLFLQPSAGGNHSVNRLKSFRSYLVDPEDEDDNKGGRYEKIPPTSLPQKSEIFKSPPGHEELISTRSVPLNIYNLPPELLEKIIDYTNLRQHKILRTTSKRMREVSDEYIMHNFRKALKRCTTVYPCSYKSAVFKSIKQATEVYIRSGFRSIFCGCLLPILDSCTKDQFSPRMYQVENFLLHFFDITDSLLGNENSQQSRLLYTVTIMRFIKAFRKSAIIYSETAPSYWKVVVELKGPWLRESKYLAREHTQACNNLLVILTELLIADITRQELKRIWKCRNKIYIFGNDNSCSDCARRSYFTLIIHGPEKISALLRSCLENDLENFKWPLQWPRDQFTFYLNI